MLVTVFLSRCGISLILLLIQSCSVFFRVCECLSNDAKSADAGVRFEDLIEQNVRGCCSAEFGYKNGVCEGGSGLAAGTELRTIASDSTFVLQLPVQIILREDGKNRSESGNDKHDNFSSSVAEFRLKTGVPNCGGGSNFLNIPILESSPKFTADADDVDFARFGRITREGFLKYNNTSYDPLEYCINGIKREELQIVLCNQKKGTPIRKCCKNDEHLKVGEDKLNCVPSNGKTWKPILHHDSHQVLTPQEHAESPTDFNYSHPSLGWCKGPAYFLYEKDYPGNPKTPFRILKDGNILYESVGGNWNPLPADSFCLDGVYPENDTILDENYQESAVFRCLEEVENEEIISTGDISEIYWMLALLSSFFVLLTIIVYGLLWENQNIHGWTLLSFFTSLFFLYICLAAMYITSLHFLQSRGAILCWGIGIGLHFSYLSTFCWMTVLNFDLWNTFRNLTINQTAKKLKTFMLYSLFAFGVPCTVLTIGITIDLMSKMDPPHLVIPEALIPQYGVYRCFLSPHKPSLVFLFGPISALLTLNFILFLLTIRSMYQVKKVARIARSNSTGNSNCDSVRLFGKLFVVMGVTWIFEVITWSTHPTTIPWWYILFDVVNICHGIFIFLIFVCKQSTIRSLEQKYPSFNKFTSLLSECTCGSWLKSKMLFCCKGKNALQRSNTLETTLREMEERRKSNDTDVTTVGTGTP